MSVPTVPRVPDVPNVPGRLAVPLGHCPKRFVAGTDLQRDNPLRLQQKFKQMAECPTVPTPRECPMGQRSYRTILQQPRTQRA